MGLRTPSVLTRGERQCLGLRDPSVEEICEGAARTLVEIGETSEGVLGDSFNFDFTLSDGGVFLLELHTAKRSARAAVQVAVDLAESGAISRADALMRIGPALVDEHLHPTIDRRRPGIRSDAVFPPRRAQRRGNSFSRRARRRPRRNKATTCCSR